MKILVTHFFLKFEFSLSNNNRIRPKDVQKLHFPSLFESVKKINPLSALIKNITKVFFYLLKTTCYVTLMIKQFFN